MIKVKIYKIIERLRGLGVFGVAKLRAFNLKFSFRVLFFGVIGFVGSLASIYPVIDDFINKAHTDIKVVVEEEIVKNGKSEIERKFDVERNIAKNKKLEVERKLKEVRRIEKNRKSEIERKLEIERKIAKNKKLEIERKLEAERQVPHRLTS